MSLCGCLGVCACECVCMCVCVCVCGEQRDWINTSGSIRLVPVLVRSTEMQFASLIENYGAGSGR